MKNRWTFRVYNALMLLALPFILAGVVFRWRKRLARGLKHWDERWGRLSAGKEARFKSGRWWWVHAVSLGEVKAIEFFLRQIPTQTKAKVLLSVVTPEALAWAVEKKLADEIIAAPIDLPWVVRRVSRTVKPELFASVESEFWPNLLREAKRAGAKVTLVNGRISEHSFRSYKRIRSLLPALWDCFDLIAVRQKEDAARFSDLGVPERLLQVTGNFKYDVPLPPAANGNAAHDPARPTVVVGSSREDEEKELLPVMEKLRGRYPGLRVIWAPRHIDRAAELEDLFKAQSVALLRKSKGTASDNVLWDTMGDLPDAYQMADIAVIGGSFVPKGGQNPLEPAGFSVPVVFGPSMENFTGIAEVLLKHRGAFQVPLPELETCLRDLLENPMKRKETGRHAREAVESQQGATNKTLALLKDLVHA